MFTLTTFEGSILRNMLFSIFYVQFTNHSSTTEPVLPSAFLTTGCMLAARCVHAGGRLAAGWLAGNMRLAGWLHVDWLAD